MKVLNALMGASTTAMIIAFAGAALVFYKTTGVFVTMAVTVLLAGWAAGLAGTALGAGVGAVGGHGRIGARLLGHGGLAAGQVAALIYCEGLILQSRGMLHMNGPHWGETIFATLAIGLAVLAGLGRAVSNSGFAVTHRASSRYAGGLVVALFVAVCLTALTHQ
jgi:hypothetical protein